LTTNVLSFFVGFGALLFVAQYLQLVVGLSPLAAGLWMLPPSGGFIVGSLLTPVLAGRVRPGLVMAAGLGLAAAGRLPEPLGHALLGAAGQAFTQGLRMAFAVSAAASIGVAVLAAVLLKGLRPRDQAVGPSA
jgi:hypothetical protein